MDGWMDGDGWGGENATLLCRTGRENGRGERGTKENNPQVVLEEEPELISKEFNDHAASQPTG
jgi:hypothetical protein